MGASSDSEDYRRHLGERLSIQYRLEGDTHPLNEVVGYLQRVEESPDGGRLLILRKRDAGIVEVPVSHIENWKVVPPPMRPGASLR